MALDTWYEPVLNTKDIVTKIMKVPNINIFTIIVSSFSLEKLHTVYRVFLNVIELIVIIMKKIETKLFLVISKF